MPRRSSIFVSSVQKELAAERRAVKDYIEGDALLRQFFDVFLFEDLPASGRRADAVYLAEVGRCDIYLGLFGNEYGHEDAEGISPTEREFDAATAARKERLIFLKGNDDTTRHPKMKALASKAGAQVIRRRFNSPPELTATLYASLVEYLGRTGMLRVRPFDAAACPGATIEDLSPEKVADFLERAQRGRGYALGPETPLVKALAHLNLLDGERPSHAAVLLFGREPQRFLASSEVKCLRFHGTEVQKPIPSYQVFKGTLFKLVDDAVDFVMSKLDARVGTRAEGPTAPVTYEIPREVVAEAIVNAVAHRDYASNASVQVMLFSDRLEVWNPGALPPSLPPEALRLPHPSIPRNPLLAEPLFLTRHIERAGTGTLDMIRLTREAGLPAPEIRQDMGHVMLTLRRAGKATPEVTWEVEAQEAQVKAQEAQVELSATEVALLSACAKEDQTGQQLLEAAGYTERTGNFKRAMDRLLADGYLAMTIPDKPTSRSQKYQLTAKGRAWLDSQSEKEGGR